MASRPKAQAEKGFKLATPYGIWWQGWQFDYSSQLVTMLKCLSNSLRAVWISGRSNPRCCLLLDILLAGFAEGHSRIIAWET